MADAVRKQPSLLPYRFRCATPNVRVGGTRRKEPFAYGAKGRSLQSEPMRIFPPMQFHVLCILATALTTHAVWVQAEQPKEQAALAPEHAMFDGMAKRDAAAIKAPLLPGGSMVLMRNGKPVQITFDDFANRVARPGTTQ